MTVLLDQPYREIAGSTLRYDYFATDGNETKPLVICIHGGGWISGDKEGMHDLAIYFGERGFNAVCVEYRLAPLHAYPAAVDDVRYFVDFCRDNAATLKIEPRKVGAIGNSAGGHLVAMCGLSNEASQRVTAVVDICGISDVTEPRAQIPDISWGFVDQFMALPYDGNENYYKSASPVYQVVHGSPPFLIFHGELDDVVPIQQSEHLSKKLTECGVQNEFVRMPGEDHGISGEGWEMILDRSVTFFNEAFE